MTNSINTTPTRPQLFLDNGSRLERLVDKTETSLETEKKELEESIYNTLTRTFKNQARSHTVKLSDDGQKIIITEQSNSETPNNPIEIPIKNLSEPQSQQTPTQNCSVIPTELLKQTKAAFEPIKEICNALKKNTSLRNQLKEWSEKTTKANTEKTATAIQHVWNEALNHIRTLHPATPEPREPGSQGEAITPTAANSNSIEFDETSLKINFSKKYISYKTKDGNTHVIDLMKKTNSATTLNLDAAIQEIEKKHNITVLNPSFNKSCDRAKELVQKGKFFDTHFLDIAPDTAKTSYFNEIQKAIEKKLKALRSDTKKNEDAIQNLEKFKNALEKKSRKKPNGVDWFAVNLAIGCFGSQKEQDLRLKQINEAVKKEFTSLKILVEGNPAATDYATDIFLLSLTREETIEFIEKNRSTNGKLLPNESKESLLARARLHGFKDINTEDFKKLFEVELTYEIQEILSTNAPKLPPGDVVLGIEDNVKPGSSADVSGTHPLELKPSSRTLSAFSSGRSENGSQSPRSNNSFRSSTSRNDLTERPLGGTASKTAIMPETISELAKGITEKTTNRPIPSTRGKKADAELRNKIRSFIGEISKDIEPSTPQDTSKNQHQIQILQALWNAETNAQRGQLIDLVEFLNNLKPKSEDTIPKEFTTALDNALKEPSDKKIEEALKIKKAKENDLAKQEQLLKEKADILAKIEILKRHRQSLELQQSQKKP